MIDNVSGDALAYHDTMKFTTFDADNDMKSYCCAAKYAGGFWYKDCSDARLTGLYGERVQNTVINGKTYLQGIYWYTSLGKDHPQYVDMKIRPYPDL